MSWALWLAAPVAVTGVAALASWWHGREPSRRRPGTAEAVQEHRRYLEALPAPPRGEHRVGS